MSFRLYEQVEFCNLLDYIGITSSDVENSPVLTQYQNNRTRNEASEATYPLAMVPPFYRFVIEKKRLPNQQEYWETLEMEYRLQVGKELSSVRKEIYDGYKSRALCRTYPSLIRDIHLNLKLKEILPKGVTVIYNTFLDLEVGVDVLIIDERNEKPNRIGICLYTDSFNANKARQRKIGKQRAYHNLVYYELPVKIDYDDNRIQLYPKSLIDNIIKKINQP